MSDKKKRSMAGLPWIAAMAFFMQALDATILNTAFPAMASRSLRYTSHFYPCRESVHVGFSGLRTF